MKGLIIISHLGPQNSYNGALFVGIYTQRETYVVDVGKKLLWGHAAGMGSCHQIYFIYTTMHVFFCRWCLFTGLEFSNTHDLIKFPNIYFNIDQSNNFFP